MEVSGQLHAPAASLQEIASDLNIVERHLALRKIQTTDAQPIACRYTERVILTRDERTVK
jgi:hypothetical protein